ncbi:hypothetical protein [Confluentibacter flavum]|uniref:Uncharacterized protein n=1 Tax=Confluentibacter flavum TaxID=1909700 RepID=A0A2N3HLD5_9FLAO|nr:hypothetical protein [Confluentibacter flavum]PKQ45658.1 hypothetical protein CSW08_06210 [Confluentibacter flavum]
MKNTFFALLLICLIFTAFKCDEDSSLLIEEDKKELAALKQTIEDLASSSVCNENTECKYIAFGSKACGGPKSYLLYSTSIDVENLEMLVEEYNQKETDFNTKHGIISDCALVMPPTGLSCENNTCIPIY